MVATWLREPHSCSGPCSVRLQHRRALARGAGVFQKSQFCYNLLWECSHTIDVNESYRLLRYRATVLQFKHDNVQVRGNIRHASFGTHSWDPSSPPARDSFVRYSNIIAVHYRRTYILLCRPHRCALTCDSKWSHDYPVHAIILFVTREGLHPKQIPIQFWNKLDKHE